MTDVWPALKLSLICAFGSALLNLPWGIFWGWLLARRRFRGKGVVQTVLFLPLVLPPVLTGYFLLILLGRGSWLGDFLRQTLGVEFVLNWKGAVLAAAVVSSPFMIQLVKQTMEIIDFRLIWAAQNLGKSRWTIFQRVLLPLTGPGVMAGFFLTFARSLGEFGATIMVAGNVPGETQTLPLAIYSQVYQGDHSSLGYGVAAALILAYAGLGLSQFFDGDKGNPERGGEG